jgi:two-component system, chemotaxis family, protein-glutamate methylesterase/glutaminase
LNRVDQKISNRGIVVIGGSAGAFDPLREILAHLPRDLPASVFVVLHLGDRSKYLPGVLTSKGRIPSEWARDRHMFERGCAYIAVPDHHLLLVRNEMRLTRGPRENRSRPSIDVLFRSAAVNYGSRVIGVLLSGYQRDGAAGLVAIQERGGTVLVQDPVSASASDMPRYALQAIKADHVGTPSELALLITDLVHRQAGPVMTASKKYDLELKIAQGEIVGSEKLREIAEPAPLTCPDCGGVLSQINGATPLRYRCQVGHAITAEALLHEHEDPLRGAMRSAQRLVEEHVELLARMAADASSQGRKKSAKIFQERSDEYHRTVQILRRALAVPELEPEPDERAPVKEGQAPAPLAGETQAACDTRSAQGACDSDDH